MARVVELTTYPVKGCAGVELTEALMTEAGLAHDRCFMVVDGDGVFRSQRRDPRLAVIRPGIGASGDQLTLGVRGVEDLRAEGLRIEDPQVEDLCVDVDRTSPPVDVEMFGTPYRAVDQGEAAARWLTRVLGAPSRLVRVPPDHTRATDGLTPGTCGFADSGAVHLISRASLTALNARITEGGGAALPMSRFRPNIVIDDDRAAEDGAGTGDASVPHHEDGFRRLTIGDTELGFTKLAIRCAVTLVDQPTGVRVGPEPLRTLALYRRATVGGVAFGTKYAVLRPGKLALGDLLDVTEWDEPRL
ncbi:MOSC N-terminal beta barrel domain-containing protein [Streptomyces sp. SID3212]|uniref:MOSC N-terminal beta barrel domain-containing protein n=1 Tax=Streptomyces sp. SID3212 TaxID=2690259 RepID=UPI00136C1F35|nr:MOSC domain-containing protein [Streptomyces sp. SID3212]